MRGKRRQGMVASGLNRFLIEVRHVPHYDIRGDIDEIITALGLFAPSATDVGDGERSMRALSADRGQHLRLLFEKNSQCIAKLMHRCRPQEQRFFTPPPLVLQLVGVVRFRGVRIDAEYNAPSLQRKPLRDCLQSLWLYLAPVRARWCVKAANGALASRRTSADDQGTFGKDELVEELGRQGAK